MLLQDDCILGDDAFVVAAIGFFSRVLRVDGRLELQVATLALPILLIPLGVGVRSVERVVERQIEVGGYLLLAFI